MDSGGGAGWMAPSPCSYSSRETRGTLRMQLAEDGELTTANRLQR